MIRHIVTSMTLIILSFTTVEAQDAFDEYRKFKEQSKESYQDFRKNANQRYADFLSRAWKEYEAAPIVEMPRKRKIPPVIAENDRKRPAEDKSIVIDSVLMPIKAQPQPSPLTPPVKPSDDEPYTQCLKVTLYGTPMAVRAKDSMRFRLAQLTPTHISRQWLSMCRGNVEPTLFDLLALREKHNLDDWSYMQLVGLVCSELFGKGTNEAEMLKAYLMIQSGYQMRLAVADDKLRAMYGCDNLIYSKLRWTIDKQSFYIDDSAIKRISMCDAAFEGEKPLSLRSKNLPLLDVASSPCVSRLLPQSTDSCLTVINSNYLAYYDSYPPSQYSNNPLTRWAMVADMEPSQEIKKHLYPQLAKIIEGKNSADAVERICNWIQTQFAYGYDDEIWGQDRAFFPDETLYYLFCDCEDRSILLSRIVRDLLGLKCVLVYYPGHLAMGVALGEDIKGDHIRINDEKFIICDPTYINASIGMTMPGMDNQTAKVIILD